MEKSLDVRYRSFTVLHSPVTESAFFYFNHAADFSPEKRKGDRQLPAHQ